MWNEKWVLAMVAGALFLVLNSLLNPLFERPRSAQRAAQHAPATPVQVAPSAGAQRPGAQLACGVRYGR